MLRKFVVSAIAAGAMSLPFAGVALADHGNNGHGNGNGNASTNSSGVGPGGNGIPGSIQTQYGTRVPPGQWLGQLRQNTGDMPLPQWLRQNTDYRSPGEIISGIAQGNFPPTDQIPAPVTSPSSGDTTSGITQGALPSADQILAPVTSQNPFDINGILQGILPSADQILAPITSPTG